MRCIVCENSYDGAFQSGEYTYVYCSICGSVRLIYINIDSQLRRMLYDDVYWINNTDDESRHCIANIEYWYKSASNYTDVNINKILDFGCGRGYLLERSEILLDLHCLGMDWSPPKEVYHKPIRIITSDAFNIINDECLDMVTCIETFQHLVDPRLKLLEFSRVVKPGGIVLVVMTPTDGHQCDPNWFYLNPPYHINLFSVQAMYHLADDCYLDLVWYDGGSMFIFKSKPKNKEFYDYWRMNGGTNR